MKSFVINLDRNPERLVAIGDRFAALGIAFERSSAVDARATPSDDVAEFRRLRPSMSWLPRGQIGCFLSHLSVWRRIADGADPHAAVFEDDVHVSDGLARYLDEASPPGDADILRLEAPASRALPRPVRGAWPAAWRTPAGYERASSALHARASGRLPRRAPAGVGPADRLRTTPVPAAAVRPA